MAFSSQLAERIRRIPDCRFTPTNGSLVPKITGTGFHSNALHIYTGIVVKFSWFVKFFLFFLTLFF